MFIYIIMSFGPEIEVTDHSDIPVLLYHVVPVEFFVRFSSKNETYDCRNRSEWGGNAPFIHTTSTLQDLQNKVAPNWEKYPLDINFLLLTINTSKLKAKFTFAIQNDVTYFHIWGSLPRNSFSTNEIKRDEVGKLIFVKV